MSGLGVTFDGIPIVPHRLEDVSKMPNLTQAPGIPSDQPEVDAVCEDTVKALLVKRASTLPFGGRTKHCCWQRALRNQQDRLEASSLSA